MRFEERKKLMHRILSIICFLICTHSANGQSDFITPADSLNKTRFNTALVLAGSTYTTFSIGLYNVWYRQYEQTDFQFFNDWNEWNNMDKYGHFYSAYFQGVLCYEVAKWTGLSENKSILSGLVVGTLFQTTIEVMDGFSEKWGFSVYDVAYNTAGVGAFAFQQKIWNEQRIQFKVSSYRRNYSNQNIPSPSGAESSNLQDRADALFGSSFAERYLKDYNAQTLWASVNIHSLLVPDSRFPKWLNLAFGTGSENLFGGFENRWTTNNGEFELDPDLYPRYRQFFIGLDLDLTKLPITNLYWKSLLKGLNIFKLPGPAIEINTQGQIKFHLIHF
jgi:uncharacterized protein YfiM (DUF2279 family)